MVQLGAMIRESWSKIVSLKNSKVSVVIAIPTVIILCISSALAGDIWHGQFPDPFVSHQSFDVSSLTDLRNLLQANFDGSIDQTKLLDGAKAGLVAAAGDPYTVYLNATDAKSLSDQLTGTFSGIGAEVGIRNNKLVIVAPIAGSPAAKAGLQAQDQIVKIDSTDPTGLTLDVAVSKIQGKSGTKVTLAIVRGNAAPFNVTITRQTINDPSVTSKMQPGNIGDIIISRFGSDTGDLVKQQAQDLISKGATKFILDLRDDPGGYLDQAVVVASQFISGKEVVEERTDNGTKVVDTLNATTDGLLLGKKTVVLVNSGSASASEIVTGALQDYKVATVVGETTFGKGSVQQIMNLSGGAELKVTVAHWYTPNGKNIGKQGIKPDVTVDLIQADLDANADPQLAKALQLLQ
jgi:carboxyl-terminal processing protease